MSELGGRYRLGEVIGTGGTATVYRATDASLGVERAVKVLRVDALGAESSRARLRAEARTMARVTHPNILRVYDVGTDEDADFVVMELAVGGSLQDRLDHRGPLPPQVACRYALQVLGALAAAHDAGVIHRDVKPQNVLLDTHGVAMLADFGIALLADGRESRHTQMGVAMGSMTYMPPEQRLDARGVGVGADVYAAGATLYALLTGASPVDLFLAAPGSVRWEDVPEPLRPVLQRATRLVPEERWGSARAMAAALLAAMDRLPPDPDEHPEDEQAWSGVRERVLASLAMPTGDPNTEGRRPPRKPPTAGVDPTLQAGALATTRPGRRRWGALAAGLAVALLVGVWAWTDGVAPRTTGGVVMPPVPPQRGAQPTDAAPIATAPATSTTDAPPASPGNTTAATGTPNRSRAPRATSTSGTSGASSGGVAVTSAVGEWTGSFRGFPARIRLTGTDQSLRGEFTVRYSGNEVVSPVRGRFDAASGRLELEDTQDAPDSGTYEAQLTGEGALDGTFKARETGRIVKFRVKPLR